MCHWDTKCCNNSTSFAASELNWPWALHSPEFLFATLADTGWIHGIRVGSYIKMSHFRSCCDWCVSDRNHDLCRVVLHYIYTDCEILWAKAVASRMSLYGGLEWWDYTTPIWRVLIGECDPILLMCLILCLSVHAARLCTILHSKVCTAWVTFTSQSTPNMWWQGHADTLIGERTGSAIVLCYLQEWFCNTLLFVRWQQETVSVTTAVAGTWSLSPLLSQQYMHRTYWRGCWWTSYPFHTRTHWPPALTPIVVSQQCCAWWYCSFTCQRFWGTE